MSTKSTEENEVLDQLKAQEVHLDLGIEKEKDQDLYPEIELLDVALQVVLKNIITEAGPDQWREEATVAQGQSFKKENHQRSETVRSINASRDAIQGWLSRKKADTLFCQKNKFKQFKNNTNWYVFWLDLDLLDIVFSFDLFGPQDFIYWILYHIQPCDASNVWSYPLLELSHQPNTTATQLSNMSHTTSGEAH